MCCEVVVVVVEGRKGRGRKGKERKGDWR